MFVNFVNELAGKTSIFLEIILQEVDFYRKC